MLNLGHNSLANMSGVATLTSLIALNVGELFLLDRRIVLKLIDSIGGDGYVWSLVQTTMCSNPCS